ncbi:MAG: MobC family replication-relaxation protein [Candidatus Sedimenticola sp. 6PFRAG5]
MTTLLPPDQRQARVAEKRRMVLRFMRDETWTHVDVLQELLAFKNVQNVNSTLRPMERDGLLKRVSVDMTYGRSITIWGITTTGQAYAFELDEPLEDRPGFEPSKIKPSTLQHRIDLQLARVRAEKAGWTNWEPGHLLGKRMSGVKLPDAIATDPQGQRVAIEIERTIKSRKRYSEILVSHLSQRKAGSWQKILYLSPTTDFAARVQRVFFSISQAKHQGQAFNVTDEHRQPFSFYSLNSGEWLTMNEDITR